MKNIKPISGEAYSTAYAEMCSSSSSHADLYSAMRATTSNYTEHYAASTPRLTSSISILEASASSALHPKRIAASRTERLTSTPLQAPHVAQAMPKPIDEEPNICATTPKKTLNT